MLAIKIAVINVFILLCNRRFVLAAPACTDMLGTMLMMIGLLYTTVNEVCLCTLRLLVVTTSRRRALSALP